MQHLLVILGPTASGKSALAVELAKKISALGGPASGWHGAEIISADSRQVYKGLNIGSGKITKEEMQGVPHHLLDVISPKRVFTVQQFKKLAKQKIVEVWKRGKLPILCGGTGFYIQAVIDNPTIPSVKPDRKLREKLEKMDLSELTVMLAKLDPKRFQEIDTKNSRRIIRAIEVATALGKVPRRETRGIEADVLQIGIRVESETLKERIAKRLRERFRGGMIDEIRELHANGVSWKRLENLGLEYRYIAYFLQGKMIEEEMKKKLESEIWQYARRQKTWFRRDKRIKWFPIEDKERIEKEVESFLKNF